MKNKIVALFFGLFILFFSCSAYADTQINLQIKTANKTIYDSSITVVPCDSDSKGGMLETPYCAILQSGVPSVWDWTWAPGAFVTSIDKIAGSTTKDKDGNDVYHYWSWSLNGNEAMDALNQYVLKPNDTILLNFVDPVDVTSTQSSSSVSGGVYIATAPIKNNVSVGDALKFLSLNQNKDGSYGLPMYTDWVAVGASDDNIIKPNLEKYLLENDINSSIATDNERRAMALMSLGINPYSGTKINYIKKIVDSFDGEQFGDKDLINDDIFALIVLKNAGYSINDEIIKKDVSYIVSKQNVNGSWGNADMTAATLQALNGFENIRDVFVSISKGENYLISSERPDGGFNNSFTTSWVLQSLFNNDQILKGEKYLASRQAVDGGMDSLDTNINARIWATSYVLPAVEHKPWSSILQKFSKQDITSSSSYPISGMGNDLNIKKINSVVMKRNDTYLPNQIKRMGLLENNNNTPKVSLWQKIGSGIKRPFTWLLYKLSF